MNRDRSIQAQSILKAVIPSLPMEQWEAGTREGLRIHDAIVGTSPSRNQAPAPEPAPSPVAEDNDGGPMVGRLKKIQRDSTVKVWAIIEDERSEVSYSGVAWRAHGAALEQIEVGEEVEVVVKYVHKDGKRYTNFETPRLHRPFVPQRVADTDIPF